MNNSTADKNNSNRPMNDGLKSSLHHASNYQHAILCLCFFILSSSAGAQTAGPLPDEQYLYTRFSISMAIIIVVLIAALFFMGFFFIYIRHFNESSSSGGTIQAVLSLRSRRAARGLDPAVIESFPTFGYSEIKTLKIGKEALECAVCLNEFEDDETLRLLPKCDHVFHPECIDAWLESHLTCPVCRTNLIPAADESNHFHIPEGSTQPADLNNNGDTNNGTEQDAQPNADVSIRVCEDQTPRPPVVNRNFSFDQNRLPRSRPVRPRLFARFRSNSTGHSLVQAGENLDRFTLRLPEEVRKEVMNRAMLNRTGSSVGRQTERSSRGGYRTGEGSSRGRSYMRFESLDRLQGKSDRWVFSMAPPFFSRWPSMKSPKVVTANNGEGSSRTPKGVATAVILPFNCFEPKSSDETGVFAADSSRPPV